MFSVAGSRLMLTLRQERHEQALVAPQTVGRKTTKWPNSSQIVPGGITGKPCTKLGAILNLI